MHPIIVFSVLSWIIVGSLGTLVVTILRIVFGSLPYAEGKYALVVAAFGIAASIEVLRFTVRRVLLAVLVSLALAAVSPAHATTFMSTGENALAPMAFVVFTGTIPQTARQPWEQLQYQWLEIMSAENPRFWRRARPDG